MVSMEKFFVERLTKWRTRSISATCGRGGGAAVRARCLGGQHLSGTGGERYIALREAVRAAGAGPAHLEESSSVD